MGCPVEPAFRLGSKHGAKESQLLSNQTERNRTIGQNYGCPFSQKAPIVSSDAFIVSSDAFTPLWAEAASTLKNSETTATVQKGAKWMAFGTD